MDFLSGEWNVVRHISDHLTGEVGVFRGQASFQRCPDGLALTYREQGELRFRGHRGPASRSLLYRELADGSADVRFADGREFYRLDLRSGTWSAEHPCRAGGRVAPVGGEGEMVNDQAGQRQRDSQQEPGPQPAEQEKEHTQCPLFSPGGRGQTTTCRGPADATRSTALYSRVAELTDAAGYLPYEPTRHSGS